MPLAAKDDDRLDRAICKRFFYKAMMATTQPYLKPQRGLGGDIGIPASVIENNKHLIGGIVMEKTVEAFKELNSELIEAKKNLFDAVEEIKQLRGVIGPEMMTHIANLRSHRMAVVSEMRESLSTMRDVRKFFLESEYEHEMARLERFVSICKQLQQLQSEGVLNAVCDLAIKLAIKES